jgi:hypothetical protein
MKTSLRARLPDRQGFLQLADWLAVGVALSLPWSTSATSVLVVVWFLAWLPTLDVTALRREVASAAGGLPVLLWALGALGMLWAAVSWGERFEGLGSFHRSSRFPCCWRNSAAPTAACLCCAVFSSPPHASSQRRGPWR